MDGCGMADHGALMIRKKDNLTDEKRTKRWLLETLNSNLDSIKLTIEGEGDFETGMLPRPLIFKQGLEMIGKWNLHILQSL